MSAGPGPAWWAVLPPAEVQVSCGEATHRLRWEDGSLTASDHPDAEGELVLAALGGERTECIDLVESWGSHGDDLEVLAVGPRSGADELTVTPDDATMMRASGGWFAYAPLAGGPRLLGRPVTTLLPRPGTGWPRRLPRGAVNYGGFVSGAARRRGAMVRRPRATAYVSSSSSHGAFSVGSGRSLRGFRHGRPQPHDGADRRAELFSLLALGAEFQFRLSATVAAAWADGGSRTGDRGAGRAALVAALTGRLAPAAQSWLGIDPGQVEVALHEDAGWGRLALSGTGSDRRLRAALPVGWLASVWAAGLAVADGHLIVEIREAAWPEATVLGVPEPGADPVILKVRADGGRWTAAAPR